MKTKPATPEQISKFNGIPDGSIIILIDRVEKDFRIRLIAEKLKSGSVQSLAQGADQVQFSQLISNIENMNTLLLNQNSNPTQADLSTSYLVDHAFDSCSRVEAANSPIKVLDVSSFIPELIAMIGKISG